jgi:pimeloyl-ACP methyl ester carboxylesterase
MRMGWWSGRATALRRRDGYGWEDPLPATPCGPLVARRSGGSGPPVLLLHGLPASGRVWGGAFDRLGTGHRLLVPDLLGFGDSPWPPSGYTLEGHAAAVVAAMAAAGVDDAPAVVAGHSFGALVALALAHHHPRLVGALVLVSPPLYRGAAEARAATRRALTWTERTFCTDTRSSRRLCRAMCMRRPWLARRVATGYRPELPLAVALDGVRHTWESYSQSFAEVVAATARPGWLVEAGVPVRVLTGGADPLPDVGLLEELAAAHPRVRLEVLAGADHLIPLSHPGSCLAAIEELAAALGRGPGRRSEYPSPSTTEYRPAGGASS